MATKLSVYVLETDSESVARDFVGAVVGLRSAGLGQEGAHAQGKVAGECNSPSSSQVERAGVITGPLVVVNGQVCNHGQPGCGEQLPAATAADVQQAVGVLGKQVDGLQATVDESLVEKSRLASECERRRDTLGELAGSGDQYLTGLRARIKDSKLLELFLELQTKVTVGGQSRYQSYTEIGRRLGGLTRQGIGARVKLLREKHPEASDYIDDLRARDQADCFSELSPEDREKLGIDKAFDHKVRRSVK